MRPFFADGLFWSSVACCAYAQFLILRSVGGRRHAAEPSASPMPRPRGATELLWAVVPALALAVLLVATWRTMHADPARAGSPGIILEAGR